MISSPARRLVLVAVVVAVTTIAAPLSPTATAAGTPDISLGKAMGPTTLYGTDIPVTLTASNATGTDGYNLSFNDTIPDGVSFAGGSPAPTRQLAQPDGSTVLIWENVADLLAGTTVDLQYTLSVDTGIYDVDDTIGNSANAYVNSDPRLVPDFDPVTGVNTGDATGSAASGTMTTTLVPFEITKSEPNLETELLRGVHDHQTTYTITVDNNLVNTTAGFSVVDFLPAGLEFLGCGTIDNSTVGEEYPSSGPINPGNAPALANPCPAPSSVTTVDTDPDGAGPLPTGVYTRVEWDGPALASALGSDDLTPGASFSFDYVAAIALFENTLAVLADPTANLDNNTGPLTTDEQLLTNGATASGFYDGRVVASTDSDTHDVTAENVSIHKSIDSGSFDQASTPQFVLDIESGEYATATSAITVTDTLPAALDFVSATPPADGPPVLNPDGTLTLTWTRPAFGAPNGTDQITIDTDVRAFYRLGDGSDGVPVAANDSFTNDTALATDVTLITDGTGSTAVVPTIDGSSAGASASGSTILKEVSEPAATLSCGDGTGVTFDPTIGGDYRPGDIVCWRLNVFFPGELDTIDPVVRDFLPAGFDYVSWAYGADNDVTLGDPGDFATDPTLTWDLSDLDVDASGDADGVEFEVVITSRIADPDAAASGDITSNLMKYSYRNTDGAVFQDRDQADASWSEPELSLDKAVVAIDAVPVGPADGVAVEAGETVTFRIALTNGGTTDALDVSTRDVLPQEIRCTDVDLGSISDGGQCVANVANDWIQWDTDDDIDVAAGTTVDLTYDVVVPAGIAAGETYVNEAGVREYTGPTNDAGSPTFTYVPADNIDTTLTPNTSAADDTSSITTPLPTVGKTRTTAISESGNNAAGQATIGETVSYTVDVDLTSGTTYYDARITDTLPAGFDLDDTSVAATLDGVALPTAGVTLSVDDGLNSWTVTFPDPYAIPSGAAREVIVTFDALVTDVGTNVAGANVGNTARLEYENATGTERAVSGSVNTRIVEPNISLAKASDDPDGVVQAGQTVTYTVTVSNSSATYTSVAHDITVVDTVPPELTVDVGSISGGGVFAAGASASDPDTITWTVASLNPGASAAFTYDATTVDPIIAGMEITNSAAADTSSLAGVDPDERDTGSRYAASADETVTAPTPTTTKSATPADVTVGEAVTYTVTAALPGGAITYDTTVLDDIPPGLVFDSLTSVTCSEGGGACSPDIDTGDATVVTVATPGSGDDVAFFFGDLTTAAADDRVLTIIYVAIVADVAAADGGATLTNSAALYWNESDVLAVPTTPPAPGGFDGSSTPGSDDVPTVEPTLTIDKDVGGQNADDDIRRAKPGDTLTYTLTITNSGSGDAHDVTVTDVATDPTWAFTDTTVAAGITNTDADPVGGLAWFVAGPIAGGGGTATITYELVVPADFDSSDENAVGAEQTNVADIPSYFGVPEATRDLTPGRDFREYDDVVADTVDIEVDLASIGDLVWHDIDRDGVVDPGEPGLAGIDVTVTYLGANGVPGGGDDEVVVVTTDADGNYLVDELPGGAYVVTVDAGDLPAGMSPSFDLDGGTSTPDGTWAGSLGEAQDRVDVDFGYSGDGSIGDTIWFDQDGDGVQDPGEAGLAGIDVTVTWAGPDGVPGNADDITHTTTTGADGTYVVDDLPAGDFTVVVDTGDLPAGYDLVSDPDGGDDDRSGVNLDPAENDTDQDFGYRGAGSIGDTVYLDEDGDGVQDVGEPGVGGVPVTLVHFGPDGVAGGGDDSTITTTTAAGGAYLFETLPAGGYTVTVGGSLPAELANTADPDGGGDSTSQLTLGLGEANLDQDFGYDAESVLGDFVWWDLNGDGVQDPGEPGLPGIEVTAVWYGPDDTPGGVDDITYVTTTDADGLYLFSDIPDGEYSVTVTDGVDAGLAPTFDDDGGLDETSGVSLVDADLDQDFGYAGSYSLGDRVWLDRDGDGVIDGTEPGIEGVDVRVTWYGPDGTAGGGDDVVVTTETDADGDYLVTGLPPGEYVVEVIEGDPDFPAGVDPTYDLDDGTTDPDGVSRATIVAADVLDVDFGYRGGGSIGDTIWFDRDRDGVLDGDEVGLSGIDVTLTYFGEDGLLGGGDDEVFTAVTDADGNYLFTGLPDGEFRVDVDQTDLPAGMTPTFDPDGGADATSRVTLALGAADLDQDFGYAGAATIGDRVFLDVDGDGVEDPGEPGVVGQTVELTWDAPGGPVVFTTTTDSTGAYQFPNLPDGDYTVNVVGGIVGAATNSSDPDGGGDSTSDVTIVGGADDLDQDFGYVGVNSIGDTVWFDVDADGVDDAGEPRLGGVTISVRWFGLDGVAGGGDDTTLSTTTDADGLYLVTGLPDGSYRVAVTGGLPPGTDVNTFDADDGTTSPDGRSIVTGLGAGTAGPVADLDQDFGYTGSGSIGDRIWLDLDGDGTQDVGEPGIPGAEVDLTWAGPDGTFGTGDDITYPTVTTGADGDYAFGNLPAGNYRVDVGNLPADVDPTADPDGGSDDTSLVTLGAGEVEVDQDFGYTGEASVGDTVFLDVDGDGTQDTNEPGVAGVTVTVTSPGADGVSGTADDIVTVVVTDADGTYVATGLPPGPTVVSYDPADLPDGFVPDSDLDGGSPTTTTVVLASGDDVRDVDFGVVGDAAVCGEIFVDADGDGVQDPGETGIAGVTVEVTWDGPDGPVTLTVVTDANGEWCIDNVPPGTYTVRIVPSTVPDGLLPSTPVVVQILVPVGGTGDATSGFVPEASVGDRVWNDVDGDGIQDAGEPGLSGITVTISDADGDVIATTVTGPDGSYLFDGLPPGTYTVRIDLSTVPSGLSVVFDPDGTDDGATVVTLGPDDALRNVDFGLRSQPLPRTGTDIIVGLMWVALALVISGAALQRFRRRRIA